MLTASEAEEDVLTALKAGARGYILKGVSGPDLVKVVRDVFAGEAYVTPTLAASLLSEMSGGRPGARAATRPLDDLTERERQILRLIALGYTNQEIAGQLFLSVRTIEAHRRHILDKLRLSTRADLVRYALERRIVEIGP